MDLDYGKILEFAFVRSFKQQGVAKFGALIVLIKVLSLLVVLIGMGLVVGAAFLLIKNPIISVVLVLFAVIFTILGIFIGLLVPYKIVEKALIESGSKTKNFSLVDLVRVILLGLGVMFAVILSLFDIKFLAILVAGVVLLIISVVLLMISGINAIFGIIGILVLVPALIVLCIYFVVMIRNSARLSLSLQVLIGEDKGIVDSMRTSWELTQGKALQVWGINFIIGLIVMVVQYGISMVLYFAGYLIFIVVFIVAAAMSAGSNGSLGMMIALTLGGLILVVYVLIMSVVALVCEVILMFGQTNVYSQLQSPFSKPTALVRKKK